MLAIRIIWAILLCLNLSWPHNAAANEALAMAAADSVSQFTAIANYCPNIIPTNKKLADSYADAFANIGRKNATPASWRKLMVSEGARRLREVQITGDRVWCENQRRFLEEAGVSGVMYR